MTAALFTLYWYVETYGVKIGGVDVTTDLFGPRSRWLLFLTWVPLVFFIVRLLDAVTFDLVAQRRRAVPVPRLLRDVVAIILYIVLFGMIASRVLDVKITGLLTTTTVLAAVLGLALQETLGNLFSGIALHMEDSYDVGDVLKLGDHIGVVEGITWRATRLRTFANNVLILPNSVLARDRLEVFPRNNLNARILTIGIDYNIPPALAIDVLTHAASQVEGVAREIPCFARVAGFTDSGVQYEIKYHTRDYSARDRIDAEIRKAVWYALRRNAMAIPVPMRSFRQYEAPTPEHSVSRESLLSRLQAVDVLTPLSEGGFEALARAAKVRSYGRGETILGRGESGDSMFIVHEGEVSVRVPAPGETGGHEVAKLGPGSVFGEMALLTGEKRTADVVALTDATAIEIGKDALQPILRDYPDLAAVISTKVAERRDRLTSSLEAVSKEEAHHTVLSRIREYFGL